jgi:hypothetical protein
MECTDCSFLVVVVSSEKPKTTGKLDWSDGKTKDMKGNDAKQVKMKRRCSSLSLSLSVYES